MRDPTILIHKEQVCYLVLFSVDLPPFLHICGQRG
jgi:hypothetical protein